MILRKLLFLTGLVLITSACGPLYSPTLPGPILIDTDTPTPTLTSPADSRMFTATPLPNSTAMLVGSYFTLTTNSNCYDGPGESYNVVVMIQSGEIVQVIGRNRDNTWWRIFKDISADCWIANEVGTFSGEVALIPITSSQYATQAWNPLPATKEKQNEEATNPDSSNPPSSNNPQPTNPPPTDPPPPAETEPPPPEETEPPATSEPSLICQLLPCP